jgi:hypothetical protein
MSAVVGTLGIVSASAEVYSVNVVGFVNVQLTNGFNLLCNPLKATNDTVAAIFPTLPNGSGLQQWVPAQQIFSTTPATFDTDVYGGWDQPDLIIAPGEAFFINSAANTTITFVGEVRQGALATPLFGPGFAFVGSQVPQAGPVTTALNLVPNNGDSIQQFIPGAQGYSPFPATYDTDVYGGWDTEPIIGIAEGFIITRTVSGNWTRTFNVQ